MTYISEYEEYGGKYVFTYNHVTDQGFIKHPFYSPCPVIEGKPLRFRTNERCSAWLLSAWQEATKHMPRHDLYCGANTEFVQGRKTVT